jgi:AraC-like DNA-binding protein
MQAAAMENIDALIRGAAIGVALVVAAAVLRARPKDRAAFIGLCFSASAVGYLLWGSPNLPAWPRAVHALVGIPALCAPFFFWALARSVFEDGFRLRASHWLILAVIILAGVAQSVLPGIRFPWLPPSLRIAFRLLSLALVAHALWLVGRGRRADLVERRYRIRVVFLAGGGIATAAILVVAMLYAPVDQWPPAARLAEAAALLLLNLMVGLALLRLDEDFLPSSAAAAPQLQLARDAGGGLTICTDARIGPDADLLTRLDKLMGRDKAWQEAGLTIADVARRAAIPEYRLRRLINQRLGFRNFTAFLNEYRLSAAAAQLADPTQARIPVLTIALELGWGSIGPFNRAFRARFGMTPTEFRRKPPAPSENPSPIS